MCIFFRKIVTRKISLTSVVIKSVMQTENELMILYIYQMHPSGNTNVPKRTTMKMSHEFSTRRVNVSQFLKLHSLPKFFPYLKARYYSI